MAAAVPLSRLLRAVELSCACCLQRFADPVRLPACGHSFCRPCILQYCKGRQRAACPLCREGFEPKDLRPNRELAALVNLHWRRLKGHITLLYSATAPPSRIPQNGTGSLPRSLFEITPKLERDEKNLLTLIIFACMYQKCNLQSLRSEV
uniref:Uncharacterized protein n=1 Tax=Melopsittacus undulatus TaxID=13146 RepID=A0A8V5H1U7_MELUD